MQNCGKGYSKALLLDVIIQIQAREQASPYACGDIMLLSQVLIQTDGFMEGIHNDTAVLAISQMTLDLGA
jgi:hypothetical protein